MDWTSLWFLERNWLYFMACKAEPLPILPTMLAGDEAKAMVTAIMMIVVAHEVAVEITMATAEPMN